MLLSWQAVFAQEIPTQINLIVVSGAGALYQINERVSQPPQVRVEDQDHKPIVGAAVVFTLPASAVTGEFDRGAKTLTVMTNDKGIAARRDLKISDEPGRFEILVNVAYRGLTANTAIAQFSTAPNGAPVHPTTSNSGSSLKKWIIILAIVGGAAAAGSCCRVRSRILQLQRRIDFKWSNPDTGRRRRGCWHDLDFSRFVECDSIPDMTTNRKAFCNDTEVNLRIGRAVGGLRPGAADYRCR